MLSMRHAPRTLPRGGREAVHTSGIRPQAAKRTQRIHAHGRHPPFHEKMRKWIAPPSSKNSETVSDTMYHAIPRRTASREIDAVHPLGPTRVHPIHPTRPRTGQCARHGHVDHHTRFDRRPKVSHHTQTSLQCGAPPMGLQFLRPQHPQRQQDRNEIHYNFKSPAASIRTHGWHLARIPDLGDSASNPCMRTPATRKSKLQQPRTPTH